MEGQDVARLATACDITDSSVEQGLEAELSVDPNGTSALATAKAERTESSTLPDTPNGGSGIPTTLARATDRKCAGIASSGAIVVLPAAASAERGWSGRFAAFDRRDARKGVTPTSTCFGRRDGGSWFRFRLETEGVRATGHLVERG